MKTQKENTIPFQEVKAVRKNKMVVSGAFTCIVFVLSCSLLGEAQHSENAPVGSSGVKDDVSLTPAKLVEPSPSESATLLLTVTRTRKPTRTEAIVTPTDIFTCCTEVTGLTPEEARDFYYSIINFITTDKQRELAGLVSYPIDVYFGETKITVYNQDQFVDHYDQIINQKIREAVRTQKPEDLHIGYEGIGFTHGEIWYSGICDDNSCKTYKIYIIAINNYSGD